MVKKTVFVTCVMALMIIAGCANVRTITDTVTLYPANASAQSWGMIEFYSQYQSNKLPNGIRVKLPKGQLMDGQMIFVENSATDESKNRFWDNVSFGVGFGRNMGSRSSVGMGISTPRRNHYLSDKQQINVNAFGENIGMNCQGEFNRRQKIGTLSCQLTNDMEYKGTLRRLIAR